MLPFCFGLHFLWRVINNLFLHVALNIKFDKKEQGWLFKKIIEQEDKE
jgi:hypothetical protein